MPDIRKRFILPDQAGEAQGCVGQLESCINLVATDGNVAYDGWRLALRCSQRNAVTGRRGEDVSSIQAEVAFTDRDPDS